MNKLFIAFAVAVALASPVALADDKTPAQPADQTKMKADREAKKAAEANMTPEEKAAAKKAKHARKHKEISKIEHEGNPATGTADAAAMKKNYEATKNDPKALKTTEEHQKALKSQSNDPPGHYPTPPPTK
ncbi:MAG TPA: hypothetical protein VFF44_13700 [Casimicrobiaceae bacterium]|nr:hypothetical protein [Casimicrobiaceae bacterium]